MSRNERQWRDLAFCLSLLTYSERSIHKLQEKLICYADKLPNDVVFESISGIIAATRKLTSIKADTKASLDEFEGKVKTCRTRGVNEDESELQRLVGTPTAHSRTATRTGAAGRASTRKSVRKPRKKRNDYEFSDNEEIVEEEEDEENDDFIPEARTVRKEAREKSKREKKRRIVQLFEDTDDDEDD